MSSSKQTPFRPPSVPLITVDPYFSIWSPADQLYAAATCHWTGTPHPLFGAVRIDGDWYTFLGEGPRIRNPRMTNVLPQCELHVDPLTTSYVFEGHGVRLRARFWTPLLLDDLDRLSKPVSFLDLRVESIDGGEHNTALLVAASPLISVDAGEQEVAWETLYLPGGGTALRVGTVDQPVLARGGDDLRIDWGHLYVSACDRDAASSMAFAHISEWSLKRMQGIDNPPDGTGPAHGAPWLCVRHECGAAKPDAAQSATVAFAYDDVHAAKYFGDTLDAYWRRTGGDFVEMLQGSMDEVDALRERCRRFDRELNAAAEAAGGGAYRDICALAYRQTIAAHKLVAGTAGEALFFSKECFSNGCMGTVDVSYPSIPLFLLYNPELVKGMMRPVLRFAASPSWPYPFAPHDVGRYPLANGQAYGTTGDGGFRLDRQMPVEECGNMLLMFAACAHADGNADFAEEHWPLLQQWAEYLIEHGGDPGQQLCTDDFAGHLAHNANLAVKACVAVGAYAVLCSMTGRADDAPHARSAAERMSADWQRQAEDGEHYRLAYDQPGSWSLKYNLVWDRLLDLDLFPAEVYRKELACYERQMLAYGVPLDNRETFTKTDWYVWCASLHEDKADFERWMQVLRRSLDHTVSRVPFTDWYYADTAVQRGFQNRTVMGGLFIRLMRNDHA